jgi:hypothetical protein
MTFRGDDLTTPATPDTSQAPQHGFPSSHPYTCVGRWAGLVGWLTGRLMVAGLSPINSRNLIIVGRCSPSLQPKRQATWWRLQRSQPRSSLSVTRMKRIESGMWNLKASPDGLAARIGRFGGTDLTVSAGQRRCANPAAYPNCRSRRRSCRGPLLLCSRSLLGSDVNRSIRSAGRKRVGLAPAGPD